MSYASVDVIRISSKFSFQIQQLGKGYTIFIQRLKLFKGNTNSRDIMIKEKNNNSRDAGVKKKKKKRIQEIQQK